MIVGVVDKSSVARTDPLLGSVELTMVKDRGNGSELVMQGVWSGSPHTSLVLS